jgi:hypothetical protein
MHFYMHSYLHKIFIPVKSGCYSQSSPRRRACGCPGCALGPPCTLGCCPERWWAARTVQAATPVLWPLGRMQATRHCAHGPLPRGSSGPQAVVQAVHAGAIPLGRKRISTHWPPIALLFSVYIQILLKFKNLCRTRLNSENYETNFVGYILIRSRF